MMMANRMKSGQQAAAIENSCNVPPFPAFPCAGRYIPLGSIEECLTRVGRSIEAQEAISLVIGPPGTGKSLVCQLLIQRYQSDRDVVVLGDTAIKDSPALLRHLLHHLGVDHASAPANDLQLALVDHLNGTDASENGLLIVVDEAQSLAADVLETIRMTTNIMRNGMPRVTAIVCGGPALDEVLVDPHMEAFAQRVATRCYLHPMSADETRDYITSIIGQCGATPDNTITPEAISAVHHGCNGVPRLVNQLMTQAIDVAEDMGQSLMDNVVVDRAWAMLQQLPSPMIHEPEIGLAASETTVEFGELSSDSEQDTIEFSAIEDAVDDMHLGTDTAAWVQNDLEMDTNAQASEKVTAPQLLVEADNDQLADLRQFDAPSDDAIAQISNATPCAADLFGEFEFEETLVSKDANLIVEESSATEDIVANKADGPSVGCSVDATPPDPSQRIPNAGQSMCSNVQPESQIALETIQHQEIVGLTDYAGQASRDLEPETIPASVPGYLSVETTHNGPHSTSDIDPEFANANETDEDYFPSDEPEEQVIEKIPADESQSLRIVDEDGQSAILSFEERTVQDDSDILLIEDEGEAVGSRLYAEEALPADAKSVAVDFQEMIGRMRTGS